MSFDVFFLRGVEGAAPDPDMAEKVQGVVRAFGGGLRGQYGYFFDLPDGGTIDLLIKEKPDSSMLALRRSSPMTAEFIFELMSKTGWAAVLGSDGAAACVNAADHPDLPELFVVGSPDDVVNFLSPAFGDWAAYRDQVIPRENS